MRLLASLVISSLLLLATVTSSSANSYTFTTTTSATVTFSGIEASAFQSTSENTRAVSGPSGSVFSEVNPVNIPGSGAADSSVSSIGPILPVSQFIVEEFTSASLFGNGSSAKAFINSPTNIVAQEVGWLTTTVNYQFTEVGTVPVGGSLFARSRIQLFTGLEFFETARKVETTVPFGESLNVNRTITGSFTRSHFFDTIGSTLSMRFQATSEAISQATSVPGPETFWPMALGLVLIGFQHWRMTRGASHTQ
jgi:hypothetical protein